MFAKQRTVRPTKSSFFRLVSDRPDVMRASGRYGRVTSQVEELSKTANCKAVDNNTEGVEFQDKVLREVESLACWRQ